MPAVDKKSVTRLSIIRAGERALARHGYRKLTMEDIAEEAGFGKRTLYLYFPNKLEICRAVMDDMLERSFMEMDRALESSAGGLEKLRKVLSARLLVRLESSAAYHHTLAEAVKAVYPGKIEEFREMAAPDVDRVEKAIRMGQEDGSVRSVHARETAELLVRGSNGFLPSAVGTREMRTPGEVQRQVEEFVDVLVRGVAR